MRITVLFFQLCLTLWAHDVAAQTKVYDVVFNGGHVIDPETNLSKKLNVGIIKNKIVSISTTRLKGKKEIDIAGFVLSPGFIDLLNGNQSRALNEYQVFDGVTTAIQSEAGVSSIENYIYEKRNHSLVNYGAVVGYYSKRYEALSPWKKQDAIVDTASMNDQELQKMKTLMKEEIMRGCIGIGIPAGYALALSSKQQFEIFKTASELSVPVFTHIREEKISAIQQAISDAVLTGTSLHIHHINSSTREDVALALEMVETAQKRGFDITTDIYPYTAAGTNIGTPVFDSGWQQRLGINYHDLQWAETGERLTKESFEVFRKKGGRVIMHMMRPEWITMAMKSNVTMIISDGITPTTRFLHPRIAGTYSRVLGKYVREEKALTLMDALKKMTIMPAKRLEKVAPAMKKKGRIQLGCDADITVFDPNSIIDKATYEQGLKFSEGIKYVMVNGTLVVDNSKLVNNVFPGQPILRESAAWFDTAGLKISHPQLFDLVKAINKHYENVSKKVGIKLQPSWQLLNRFGKAYLNNNMPEKAYQLFKLNLDNYPEIENVYISMGDYYVKVGDKSKAIEFYESSLKIYDDPDVRALIQKIRNDNK